MTINSARTMTEYDPRNGDFVAVLGVGALGSKVAMELACLGVKEMVVYDFDVVEAHNLANQAYMVKHIGMLKTDAITEMIAEKTGDGCEITIMGELHEDSAKFLRNVTHIFLAFDSFEARIMALKIIEDMKLLAFTFDARLGAYHGNTAFCGEDVAPYREWLEKMRDQRTEPETSACGLPISLGFTSSVVAGTVVSMFVQHCSDRMVYDATEINLASLHEIGMEGPWIK